MELQRLAVSVGKSIFGDESVQLLDAKTLHNSSSRVHRLVFCVDGVPTTLFVKLPAITDKAGQFVERLRREYTVTMQVKAAMLSNPELDTVTPAGYIEGIDGLATWGVSGVVLEDLINKTLRLNFRGKNEHLSKLAGLAGCWLQRFHSLNLLECDNSVFNNLIAYCANRLDELSRIEKSNISKNLAESLKRTISGWIEDMLAAPETKIILCHNDYSPHNIIVTTEGICVLDFSFAGPGVPAFDLACFWHKLQDLKSSPFVKKRKVEILQNRFLDAYGQRLDGSRPEVKLGLARLVLSKMLTVLRSHPLRPDKFLESRRRYASYVALLKSEFEVTEMTSINTTI